MAIKEIFVQHWVVISQRFGQSRKSCGGYFFQGSLIRFISVENNNASVLFLKFSRGNAYVLAGERTNLPLVSLKCIKLKFICHKFVQNGKWKSFSDT